jgi:hypothetical protein
MDPFGVGDALSGAIIAGVMEGTWVLVLRELRAKNTAERDLATGVILGRWLGKEQRRIGWYLRDRHIESLSRGGGGGAG